MVKLNGIAVAIYFAFSLIILVCALVFIRLRLKTKIKPFLIGGLTWLLFATMLEGSVHGVVLSIFPGLRENTLAFAIYGGLMAGIFEELGRYLAFKVFFKRDMENDKNALAYAAGHGGFEATYLLITGALGMIVMASLINSGLGAELGDQLPAALASIEALTVPMALLAIIERISAIIAHFGLTMFVWLSFKYKKPGLLFAAIGIHAAFDAISVLAASAMPVWATEIVIFVIALCIGAAGRLVWKKHRSDGVMLE